MHDMRRHARWLLRLLVVALLVGGGCSSSRSTYYVDPRGDDSKNGRSPATAWRTVGHVNAASLVPGDVVLFARGGVWNEALAVNLSDLAAMGAAPRYATLGYPGDLRQPSPQWPVERVIRRANDDICAIGETACRPRGVIARGIVCPRLMSAADVYLRQLASRRVVRPRRQRMWGVGKIRLRPPFDR